MNINCDVPLDKRGQNTNIKGHILDERIMNKHGFNLRGSIWNLDKRLHPKAHISMDINLCESSVSIKIIDDDFLQTYDYVRYGNEIIWNNIQDIMQDLTEAGIITGYKRNDYI